MNSAKRNILFILFVVSVFILTAIYFTAPERKEFHRNQLGWWHNMWQVMTRHTSAERE
jgi:hypothetical protein